MMTSGCHTWDYDSPRPLHMSYWVCKPLCGGPNGQGTFSGLSLQTPDLFCLPTHIHVPPISGGHVCSSPIGQADVDIFSCLAADGSDCHERSWSRVTVIIDVASHVRRISKQSGPAAQHDLLHPTPLIASHGHIRAV